MRLCGRGHPGPIGERSSAKSHPDIGPPDPHPACIIGRISNGGHSEINLSRMPMP